MGWTWCQPGPGLMKVLGFTLCSGLFDGFYGLLLFSGLCMLNM